MSGRLARQACLCTEGVADLVDGNGKGSTNELTPANSGKFAPTITGLSRPWTECGRNKTVTNVNSKNQ